MQVAPSDKWVEMRGGKGEGVEEMEETVGYSALI